MNTRSSLIALAALAALMVPRVARAHDERVRELIDHVDDLWRGKSSKGVLEMKVVTANYTREMKMQAWSLGKRHSLVRILSPRKERGTATLKADNQIYTYLPKTDRTIRLTSGMMMGSWMGSHFTNDDLVKESRLLDDYSGSVTFEGERDGKKIIEITLQPNPDAAVVWGKIVLVIEADTHLPLSEVYYDEDGQVARTMTLSDVRDLGGRRIPTRMRMVPADKPNESTEIVYEEMAFDVDIDASFFSLGRLRRR